MEVTLLALPTPLTTFKVWVSGAYTLLAHLSSTSLGQQTRTRLSTSQYLIIISEQLKNGEVWLRRYTGGKCTSFWTIRSLLVRIHMDAIILLSIRLTVTIDVVGDLIGFQGYLNASTPFSLKGQQTLWKSDRHYLDFDISNDYLPECQYPRFWNETGYPIDKTFTDQMVGCYDSDFDQYGDTEAFGVFPDFQRQLTKFVITTSRWKMLLTIGTQVRLCPRSLTRMEPVCPRKDSTFLMHGD
jgi:hypothetical protein